MNEISRRKFLEMSLLGAGAFAILPWGNSVKQLATDWPDVDLMGRNCVGGMINMRLRPTADSAVVRSVYEDEVFVWLQDVIGEAPPGVINRTWIETPEGYLYAPNIQPVKYQPNEPVDEIPVTEGGSGMWFEITVPYVDIHLENAPCSYWLKQIEKPRLYYSQVLWVDEITRIDQGQILYRVNEKYGNCGDTYWASADAFRPITEQEIEPISPDAENKRIVVDLNHQVLSCYEGSREVYFCRISSGAKFDYLGAPVDEWATPLGAHLPWRKTISLHMGGGSTGAGYDTPGIGWTTLFDPDGAAIHSTFWHNDFGVPRSHGCVNARPGDAKWIFRWSLPHVPYFPGNVDLSGPGGTVIDVIEA
ncbi:MAG: L,D-transpeptidase [Anaerolineaceae bacterium]|nr:L,D-transpeptidase [Anaerolineaceae bacterium]